MRILIDYSISSVKFCQYKKINTLVSLLAVYTYPTADCGDTCVNTRKCVLLNFESQSSLISFSSSPQTYRCKLKIVWDIEKKYKNYQEARPQE